jgi:hypothetical protein
MAERSRVHIQKEHLAQVPLAEDNDMIKTFLRARIGIVAHNFPAAENRSRRISSCRREASLRNNFHVRSTSA